MVKFPLGDSLRIFSLSKEKLELLKVEKQLKKFADYVRISEIKGYATFSRKQFKSNPERLARQYAKRHNITLEEALIIYDDIIGKETKLPFVMMKSGSSNKRMRIFIEKNIRDTEEKGSFTTYGLSKTSTVPYF